VSLRTSRGRLDPAAAATAPARPACWTNLGGVQHQEAALRTAQRRARQARSMAMAGCLHGGWRVTAASLITRMAARPVLSAGLVITVAALVGRWRAPPSGSHAVDGLPPGWPRRG
jgi:hypothetical protein